MNDKKSAHVSRTRSVERMRVFFEEEKEQLQAELLELTKRHAEECTRRSALEKRLQLFEKRDAALDSVNSKRSDKTQIADLKKKVDELNRRLMEYERDTISSRTRSRVSLPTISQLNVMETSTLERLRMRIETSLRNRQNI